MTNETQQARRRAFEAWHNQAYGPQDKYNPIRSLAYDTFNAGLGYDDPVVSAQFFSFCGALDSISIELPDCTEFDFPSGAAPAIAECRAAIESTGLGIKII